MFTGIIRHQSRVLTVEDRPHGLRLAIEGPAGFQCSAGESIAVNGCCLTLLYDVSEQEPLLFDVVPETLRRTMLGQVRPSDPVNLEPAATASTMLSGHIVQGHVDGVGNAARVDRRSSDASGEEVIVRITPPADLHRYVVEKGSIAVDGVSLTVSAVGDDWFEVALIPATRAQTTLDRIGRDPVAVNLEVDYLVKAVVSHLDRMRAASRG